MPGLGWGRGKMGLGPSVPLAVTHLGRLNTWLWMESGGGDQTLPWSNPLSEGHRRSVLWVVKYVCDHL